MARIAARPARGLATLSPGIVMMSLLLVALLVYTGPAQAGISVDVDIEKFVNGVDADTALLAVTVPVGSTVTFTYTLENFGLETL